MTQTEQLEMTARLDELFYRYKKVAESSNIGDELKEKALGDLIISQLELMKAAKTNE